MCRHNNALYLFYAVACNCALPQIGCAASCDAVQWTRLSREPLLINGLPSMWNASESGLPSVFADGDGQVSWFYQGSPDNGETWFLSRKRVP